MVFGSISNKGLQSNVLSENPSPLQGGVATCVKHDKLRDRYHANHVLKCEVVGLHAGLVLLTVGAL